MNKKNTKTVSTPELAVELSNFNFDLQDFEDEKIYVISYNWTNKETKKSGTSFKYFGLIGDESKLKFKEFKAKNELKVNGSLAIFGHKGLIKTAQESGLITEELDID